LLVTDKLRSYAAAFRRLRFTCPHQQRLRNNGSLAAVVVVSPSLGRFHSGTGLFASNRRTRRTAQQCNHRRKSAASCVGIGRLRSRPERGGPVTSEGHAI
jgi:hypothetical protein